MKRSDAFPSQYFSKDDVQTPIRLTIASVSIEAIKGEHGEDKKPVMSFREVDAKPLILNNTNWVTIEDAYGEDSDYWDGKLVELYCDPTIMFGSKRVGGVRVRIPAGLSPSSPPALLSWEQAMDLALSVGITKDQLVERLKAKGATGYSAVKHTVLVKEIIEAADKSEPTTEAAFDDGDSSIPF